MGKSLTIGTLARRAGVNIETVRYYQRRGLVGIPRKPPGGVRRYGEDFLTRLHFIKRAQQLGFSLREIRELLTLGDSSCARTRRLAERKRADIDLRLQDLKAMRDMLEKLIYACRAGRRTVCPIIESLSSAETATTHPRAIKRRTPGNR